MDEEEDLAKIRRRRRGCITLSLSNGNERRRVKKRI
jgi:hypothetical protein